MNMKSVTYLRAISVCVCCAFLLGLVSCNKKVSPFNSSGKTREMVVVLPKGDNAESLKTYCKELFGQPIAMLPQAEPQLDLVFTQHNNFSNLFKSYRNVLVLDVDPDRYTTGILKHSHDVWANGQNVFVAQSPDTEVLKHLLSLQNAYIEKSVVRSDILRFLVDLKQTYSSQFAEEMEEYVPGYTINIPNALKWNKFDKDFAWASNMNEGNGGRVDLVVYSFPYRDTDTFTKEYLLNKRDSVMKEQILGEYPDSYMVTEHRVEPEMSSLQVFGEYRASIRSLWQMHGDMMGGPFVMHAFVSQDHKRVIVGECYVYAPQKEKRRLLLWGEASLYSLRPAGTELNLATVFPARKEQSKASDDVAEELAED